MFILIFFLFGLAIGSALNAIIYRLHTKKSWLRGSSICPKCSHQLAWYDLIPVISFLTLAGRCRYCRKKISIQYPLVELATGVLFVFVYLVNPITQSAVINQKSAILILNLAITAILILIFVYDLKHYIILDKVIIPSIVIVFLANLFLGKSWQSMLIAALVVSIFFLLQFLVSRGKWIGAGDLRLGFFMGVVLAWPLALLALFLAYIAGSLIGILLVVLKLKRWRSQLPFATFLCPATFITLLWGEQILNWYVKLF